MKRKRKSDRERNFPMNLCKHLKRPGTCVEVETVSEAEEEWTGTHLDPILFLFGPNNSLEGVRIWNSKNKWWFGEFYASLSDKLKCTWWTKKDPMDEFETVRRRWDDDSTPLHVINNADDEEPRIRGGSLIWGWNVSLISIFPCPWIIIFN